MTAGQQPPGGESFPSWNALRVNERSLVHEAPSYASDLSGDRRPGLGTFSASLRDARKSADSLLLTAQSTTNKQMQRLKSSLDEWESHLKQQMLSVQQAAPRLEGPEAGPRSLPNSFQAQRARGSNGRRAEWTPVNRLGSIEARQQLQRPFRGLSSGPAMRKTQSAADFRQLARQQPSELTHSSTAQEDVLEWDFMSALNRTLSSVKQPPERALFSLEADKKAWDQEKLSKATKQLLGDESAKNLETLLQGPKQAIQSLKQTPVAQIFVQTGRNMQDNLQSLGTLIQQIPAPFSPTARSSSGIASSSSSTFDLLPFHRDLSLHDLSLQTGLDGENGPWALYSNMLRLQEVAALEAAISDSRGGEGSEPGMSEISTGWGTMPTGPFQEQIMKRRRKQRIEKEGSDLREEGRQVAIYTTAALPWMTGTAVNPLLRAAYLARDSARQVTLVIPWLAVEDQALVFPNNLSFDTPEEQEQYVRDWAKKRTGLDCNFKVAFYPGRYAVEKCSILPVGDPTAYIPDNEADVAVLEEPEHLNWYHHGRRWTDKFNHVVGVMHTNYLDYARREENGDLKARLLAKMNEMICSTHCHKVIKLSDAVQPLQREVTEFVHGVPASFLEVGARKAQQPEEEGAQRFSRGAYFMGKVVWAKGYTELLGLLTEHNKRGNEKLHIDCYGNGEDMNEVRQEAAKRQLDLSFHGSKDHLNADMHEYRVFINPSTSDVVATTTAEALAMGKWAIVLEHPSNKFFSSFSNCLTYKSSEEFSSKLAYAMSHDPAPMPEEERQRLTWEAATERFLEVASLAPSDRPSPLDTVTYVVHNTLTGMEPLREICGAGVDTLQNPPSLKEHRVNLDYAGGFFDNKQRAAARQTK